jgi:hypothetical protein
MLRAISEVYDDGDDDGDDDKRVLKVMTQVNSLLHDRFGSDQERGLLVLRLLVSMRRALDRLGQGD